MTRVTDTEVLQPRFPAWASARRRWWLWPNLLAVDAPVIAILWQQLFAASAGVSLLVSGRLALGFAVWAVYLADRLLDVRAPAEGVEASRHQFSRVHSTFMRALLATALVAASCIAVYLRKALLFDGAVIAILVVTYFSAVHLFGTYPVGLPKEVLVAILFAAGTILAPWSRTSQHTGLLVGALAFFTVCLLNVTSIETFEWRRLRCGGPPIPARLTRMVADNCTVAGGSLALVWAVTCAMSATGRPVIMASAMSVALLSMLARTHDHLSSDLFRVLADAALLSPVLVCFAWMRCEF